MEGSLPATLLMVNKVMAFIFADITEVEDMSGMNTVAQVGIRYLLPYFIKADVSIDHRLRPQIRLSAEYLIFRRV
jgi:hypothetical protein